jgi:predicted 3-demethylubiquinone-9 3-methyltransferase (glyoxalase superfamily)
VRLVQGSVGLVVADHPRVLTEAMAQGGAVAKRAFDAMMTMKKIDVARIEAAVKGG